MSYKKPKEPGLIPSKSTLGKKTRNPGYEPGNHWVICDRCGFATRANDARITWDNLVVCPADWEPRHPQDFVRGREDKIAPSEPIRPEGPDQFVESPAPNLVAPIIDYTDIGDGNFYFDGWADYPEYSYLVLDADTGEVLGECEVELGEKYYFWYETEVNQDGPFNFQVIIRNEKDDRTSPPSNIVGYFPAPYISITDETDETFSFRGIAEYPNADYLVFDGSTGQQVGICLVYYDVLEGTYFFSFETEKGDEGPFDFYVEIFEQSTDKRSIESNTVGYAPPVTTDILVISSSGGIRVRTGSLEPLQYSTDKKNWTEFTGTIDLYLGTTLIYLRPANPGSAYNGAVTIGSVPSVIGFEGIIEWWDLGVRLLLGANSTHNFSVPTTPPPNVTDLSSMFANARGFNSPNVVEWDVSGITSLANTFYTCHQFNQDISGWDTSSVTNMNGTFYRALNFNQDIGNWDVSKVTDMRSLLYGATAFNQDLSNWDTSKVEIMSEMFREASSFNSDISSWDTSNATAMARMFYSATSFNQDLSGWCVSKIPSIPIQFDSSTPAWVKPGRQPVWGTCPRVFPGDTLAIAASGPVNILIYGSFFPFQYSLDGENWVEFYSSATLSPESDFILLRPVLNPGVENTTVQVGHQESSTGFDGILSWWNHPIRLLLGTDNPRPFDVPSVAPPIHATQGWNQMFRWASGFNSPNVSSWEVSSVTWMDEMFANATSFNQDLSGWYAPLIPYEPFSFSYNTPSWVKTGRMPKWNTSPP